MAQDANTPVTDLVSTKEAELELYGDGQPWDQDRVVRGINFHAENIIVSGYEIGRLLLFTKAYLGHGAFLPWVGNHCPFDLRTAQRYMQLATFLTAHPRLREPLSRGRLKNVLLLTSLPPEMRDELIQDGHLGQVPAEELGTMPYVQLRKLKETLEEQLHELREERDTLQDQLASRNETIANLTERTVGNLDARIAGEVAGMRTKVETLMSSLGMLGDFAAQRWSELDPKTRAQVDGLYAWLSTWTAHETLRQQTLRGDDTPVWQFDDLAQAPRPAKEQFGIPKDRDLPGWDEHDPSPSLRVVNGADVAPSKGR